MSAELAEIHKRMTELIAVSEAIFDELVLIRKSLVKADDDGKSKPKKDKEGGNIK